MKNTRREKKTIKIRLVVCIHETRYGDNCYTRILKKDDDVNTVVEEIMKQCDYDEDANGEYFNFDVEEVVINIDDFEVVES